MRILVIGQHYWPENFRITEICEELAARGHDVTILTGLPNYPTGIIPEEYRRFRNRKQERNGVHIRRCFEIGRRPGKLGLAVNYVSFMTSASLKAIFRRHDYDVVFAYSTSPVLMSLPAALHRCFFRQKYAIYVLDIWPACLATMNVREGSKLYAFMKPVSKWVYKKADLLLYSSKLFQNYLWEVHGLRVPDENYMPQFADGLFESAPEAVADKDTSVKHLLFAGNIGFMQSVETLVKAADILRDEPVRWHIVGDGSSYEDCRALCESLSLSDKMTFYGRKPLSDMPAFYAMADAMIVSMANVPELNLTLPAKVQSYMAAGKPVLGSVSGGAAYVIEDARCGFCAEPGDPDAFADVVRRFLNCEDADEMGKRAKAYYEQHFAKKQQMDRLEAMLLELAERK